MRTNKVYTTNKTYADLTVTGTTNPFTADGRIVQMKLGNNLWETYNYRTPGTATSYNLGTTQGGWDLTQLEYGFHATQNDGNVQNQTIRRGTGNTWIQSYAYDALNRLWTVSESSGGTWSQTYSYDRYGNRHISANTNMSTITNEPISLSDFNAANNRLTTLAGMPINYDEAGNQFTYPTPNVTFSLEYDAENRNKTVKVSGVTQVTYSYDGDGRRVQKEITSGATTYFIYDAMGQMAVEYSTATATPGTAYMFTDMLGSVRTITDATGAVVENYDYLPFGRMLKASNNGRTAAGYYPTDPDNVLSSRTPQKFTGKERDAETGLDFFLARYYSAVQGRFMSPDLPFVDQVVSNPQSWNLYGYVRNSPTVAIDPDGESTHTDKFGTVIAVYNDGDRGIYRHIDLSGPVYGPLNMETAVYEGETQWWDEFRGHNDPTGEILSKIAPNAQINFGMTWDEIIYGYTSMASNMDLTEIAQESKDGGIFDIKKNYNFYEGRLLCGKYATARSAGNYLAGYNGAIGTLGGTHISWEKFQKMAGLVHISLGQVPKWQLAMIFLFGRSYGPAPWYGEIEYQGRMSYMGFMKARTTQ